MQVDKLLKRIEEELKKSPQPNKDLINQINKVLKEWS